MARPASHRNLSVHCTSVDGSTMVIKQGRRAGCDVKLTDNVQVFGVVPATLADVKTGAFIAVGAMPQPDGSQKAIQVMIFAESQRGLRRSSSARTQ